jgi:hypothetical protein
LTARCHQQGNRGANIVWPAGATQRGVARDHFVHLGVITHGATAEIGFDRTGGEDIHADVACTELLGLVTRQHFHRAFHGCISAIARQAETGQTAGNIDDACAVIEQWQQGLREEKRPLEMDVHQQVELFDGGVDEIRMHADPGVVDQKVEVLSVELVAQDSCHFGSEIGELFTAPDVELQHGGATTEAFDFGDQRLSLIGAAVVSADDVDALGDQMQGCVFAKATTGAGDQCDFTVHGTSSSAVGSGCEEVYLSAAGLINMRKSESLVG